MLTYEQMCDRADGLAAGTITAVTPGPGKFEANEDRVLAENLWEGFLDGWTEDAESTGMDDGSGWNRIGRFVLIFDSQGFVTVVDEGTEEKASATMEEIRKDLLPGA